MRLESYDVKFVLAVGGIFFYSAGVISAGVGR